MAFLPSLQNYQNIPSERKLSFYVLAIWVAYLILSPFYIFPKGRPQPADFILIMAIIPVLASVLIHFKTNNIKTIYIIGMLFVLTTIGVNFINYIFFPDIRFLLTMMIYPYNFLVFLFVIWLFQKDLKTAKLYTFYGLIATIIIQLIFIQFADSGYRGARGTAGFENPNQLAYWTLLTTAMIIFLRRGEKLRAVDWGLLFLLLLLQSLALSKAGIIAHSILMMALFISPKISKTGYILIFIAIASGIFYASFNPSKVTHITDRIEPLKNVIARIEGIGTEADDSPEARGYYRIIEYPLYTLFGSGEGAFYRFNAEGYNRELHSGIATIIFSYGLIGATLFGTFLLLVIYRQPWYYILLFTPIILFGLPHQNFRFAHFWVFLGINYGIFLAQMREDIKQKLNTVMKETEC